MTVFASRVARGAVAFGLVLSPAFGQGGADWSTQADSTGGQEGDQFTLVCPPNGTISTRVWGTDLYTADSSVCSCAVHAGLITTAGGGEVTIQVEPGAPSYRGSLRNGVASSDWGAFSASFRFVGGLHSGGAGSQPAAAGTNLALHKPASQSSTYPGGYPAGNCADGVKSPGNVCATNADANPWWQVDLQGSYVLSEIVVTNRSDCCGERGRTLTVLLSADGQGWDRIYSHDGSDFRTLRVDAGGRTARYVRLQLAATDYLNLDEVEVFGAGGTGSQQLSPRLVTGSWSGGACHVVDVDGERLLVTLTWVPSHGPNVGRRVVLRAEGRVRENQLYITDFMWPGETQPRNRTEYFLTLSADGNQLKGYYTIDGVHGADNPVGWTRDRPGELAR